MGPGLFRVGFGSIGSRGGGVDCSTQPPQIPILEVSEQNLFYQKNFYSYLPPEICRPSAPLMSQPIMAGEACLFFVFRKWMNFRLHASFLQVFTFYVTPSHRTITGWPICIWTILWGCLEVTGVGNFWFLSPLVLSKWEDLAFSVCLLFEESVFIFQFSNNKMHNYVLFAIIVHLTFKNWKTNAFPQKV